jgi:hypothetical protein
MFYHSEVVGCGHDTFAQVRSVDLCGGPTSNQWLRQQLSRDGLRCGLDCQTNKASYGIHVGPVRGRSKNAHDWKPKYAAAPRHRGH